MLLNRLNPLKELDDEQRKAFISDFRYKSEAFGNRDLRLALMDENLPQRVRSPRRTREPGAF